MSILPIKKLRKLFTASQAWLPSISCCYAPCMLSSSTVWGAKGTCANFRRIREPRSRCIELDSIPTAVLPCAGGLSAEL